MAHGPQGICRQGQCSATDQRKLARTAEKLPQIILRALFVVSQPTRSMPGCATADDRDEGQAGQEGHG